MTDATQRIIAASRYAASLADHIFLGPSVMSSSTLRILGYVALALSAFAGADGAEAALLGSTLASFGRSSPVQTVQFGGSNCYYADGWNGRGWYQCGNEWNDGFGWIGPFNLNTFGGSAIRRHHHDGVVASHPRALNPVYPRLEPPRRLSAGGAPAFHTFGGAPGQRRFGAGGVPTAPNFRAGAATVSPGFAGGGFHGGLGGGNFHHFHGAGVGVPHIGAPVSPGFAGGGGLHGLGGATGVHIGAPASPGFAGVGGFHGGGFHGLGGATGVHIGAPASPSFAGVGTFHAGGGFHGLGGAGGAHIGAFASPGFAGGGFHGVGAGGAFQGGGAAFGQGGIGHR
jgi:hypothetical protein